MHVDFPPSGWYVPAAHFLHDSLNVGASWYVPGGHSWHRDSTPDLVLLRNVPSGQRRLPDFDGLDDGEVDGADEGHASPNCIEPSSDANAPPSLMRSESRKSL